MTSESRDPVRGLGCLAQDKRNHDPQKGARAHLFIQLLLLLFMKCNIHTRDTYTRSLRRNKTISPSHCAGAAAWWGDRTAGGR